MVRLSIIITAGRDTSALEDTLVSVLTHRPADCEILVAHAGTYDDPYGMGDEIRLLESAGATHEKLVAEAIDAAGGEIIHLLAPGCEVKDHWCDAAISKFDSPGVGSVAPVLVSGAKPESYLQGVATGFAGRRGIHASGERAMEHAAKKVIGPTMLAAFYRATALDEIGGWPREMSSEIADIDVALSLQELGFESAVAADCLISLGSAKPPQAGVFRRSVDQEQLFWRHENSYLGRALRPFAAAAQCLVAGMPWSIVAACCGKLIAQGRKPAAQAHRELIIAALEHEGESQTDAYDDGKSTQDLRRAA